MQSFFWISHSTLYSPHSATRECPGRGHQLHYSSLHMERSKPTVHQRHQPGLQGDPSFCCPLVVRLNKITVFVAQFISITPQWQLHSTYWHFLPGDWDGRCALWSFFFFTFSFFILTVICFQLLAWEPGHEEDVVMVTVRPNFQDSVHVGYVAGLKKFSEYYTSVLCFTTPGDGPRSLSYRIRTHEDSKCQSVWLNV